MNNDEWDFLYKKLEKRHIIRLLAESFLLGIAIGLYIVALLVIFAEV